jgi:lipopolysaccharide/colanic/teichoic acid biosynthesis glycosyltransferase
MIQLQEPPSRSQFGRPPLAVAVPKRLAYLQRRAVASRAAAALMLIPLAPALLLLAALVRATSPGPAVYRQRRVGKEGREFTMLKLRTMRHDAERGGGPVWASRDDVRVTRMGKWLRLLHLDELPQLINVLRGEMDFIGPRPERLEIIERDELVEQVEDYLRRHEALPGITGLAQVNLPPDESLDCVRKKVALDLEYLATASFLLDLRIVACTLVKMLGVPHRPAVHWLGLARPATLTTSEGGDCRRLAAPTRIDPARSLRATVRKRRPARPR